MKLLIEIELDNDAFVEGGVDEVRRLLESVGDRVPLPLRPTVGSCDLHDANGNWVGDFAIKRGKVNR
jgi:hypothetical protein